MGTDMMTLEPGSIQDELMRCVSALHLIEMRVRKMVRRLTPEQEERLRDTPDCAIDGIRESAELVLCIIESINE